MSDKKGKVKVLMFFWKATLSFLFRNYSNVFSGKYFTTEAPGFAKATTRQAEDTELPFLFAHRDQPSLKLWHDMDDDGKKRSAPSVIIPSLNPLAMVARLSSGCFSFAVVSPAKAG
jgi:hypothetical protein